LVNNSFERRICVIQTAGQKRLCESLFDAQGGVEIDVNTLAKLARSDACFIILGSSGKKRFFSRSLF
jgi:hypothetical protein